MRCAHRAQDGKGSGLPRQIPRWHQRQQQHGHRPYSRSHTPIQLRASLPRKEVRIAAGLVILFASHTNFRVERALL
jgi:hypothetical protein